MCAAKFALNFALTILLTLSTLKEFTDDHKVPIIHTFQASFLDCRRWGLFENFVDFEGSSGFRGN